MADAENKALLQVMIEGALKARAAKADNDQDAEALPQQKTSMGLEDTRSTKAKRWSPLESITVKNFKAAKEARIPLERVTILVGPNGCGKSSVLQAVHWAARSASYILPKYGKELISLDVLDYVPSSEPLSLLHKGELKSGLNTTPVEIVFSHRGDGEESAQASVKIRAARNRGGISVYLEGGPVVTPYKQRYQFITAYIPGLAGLSEKEVILAQPYLRRQAASGDAGGVLRNILLNVLSRRPDDESDDQGKKRIEKLNQFLQEVHPEFSVSVHFDEREDYHISANITTDSHNGKPQPLETAATGVLQVIQIFSYLLLFEPRILLIDEPDAHLHPDKQERLVETLERAAEEFNTQVILTTHSPHIVRAAKPSTQLVWMKDGEVQSEDDDAIRRLLGWGGLDKAALFFIEDEDDKPLRAILRQWPDIYRQLAVCRCFGLTNLPRDQLLRGLLVDGDLKFRAIIHRDGDFMSDIEKQKWNEKFATERVYPWVTRHVDIEAYFCQPEYLSTLFGIELDEANELIATALEKVSGARDKFLEKRKKINQDIWPDGGSPDAKTLWVELGEKNRETVLGKKLHRALKTAAKDKGYDEKLIDKFHIPKGVTVAEDLKVLIESAIS